MSEYQQPGVMSYATTHASTEPVTTGPSFDPREYDALPSVVVVSPREMHAFGGEPHDARAAESQAPRSAATPIASGRFIARSSRPARHRSTHCRPRASGTPS